MSAVNVAVDLSAAEAVAATALALPDQARELTITSHADFEAAGMMLVEIRRRRVAIADAFKPAVTRAHQTHKEVLALCKKADAPCEEAERSVKLKMGSYQQEQERERRRAEERARQERERQEAEQRAEHARRQREADAEADRARMLEAEAAMDGGDLARAERLLETPAAPALIAAPEPIVPSVVEAPPVPKAAGVSFRRAFKWRLVDAAKVKAEYLCVDEKKIERLVRALGADAAAAVGGIDVYEESVVAARVG